MSLIGTRTCNVREFLVKSKEARNCVWLYYYLRLLHGVRSVTAKIKQENVCLDTTADWVYKLDRTCKWLYCAKLDSRSNVNMSVAPVCAHGKTFSHQCPWKICRWSRRFERYHVASGLNKNGEDFQVNSLIYFMGNDAEDILNASSLGEVDKLKYDKIKNVLQWPFCRKTQFPKLAEHREFVTLREELIRDHIGATAAWSNTHKKMTLRDSNKQLRLQIRQSLLQTSEHAINAGGHPHTTGENARPKMQSVGNAIKEDTM